MKELHSRLRDSASDFVADRETLILLRVESTKPCTCALISLFSFFLDTTFVKSFLEDDDDEEAPVRYVPLVDEFVENKEFLGQSQCHDDLMQYIFLQS